MDEERIVENVMDNYNKALKNKIYLDGLYGFNVVLNPSRITSIYMYDVRSSVFDLRTKCNHIFLYGCRGVTVKVFDCVSGITCMNCADCNILFKKTPDYNIEVSSSFGMNLRSLYYNMPLIYKNVSINVIKSVDCVVYEYYNISDGMFGSWNYNFFNF
jgi:hypothetical protein